MTFSCRIHYAGQNDLLGQRPSHCREKCLTNSRAYVRSYLLFEMLGKCYSCFDLIQVSDYCLSLNLSPFRQYPRGRSYYN